MEHPENPAHRMDADGRDGTPRNRGHSAHLTERTADNQLFKIRKTNDDGGTFPYVNAAYRPVFLCVRAAVLLDERVLPAKTVGPFWHCSVLSGQQETDNWLTVAKKSWVHKGAAAVRQTGRQRSPANF